MPAILKLWILALLFACEDSKSPVIPDENHQTSEEDSSDVSDCFQGKLEQPGLEAAVEAYRSCQSEPQAEEFSRLMQKSVTKISLQEGRLILEFKEGVPE